MTVINRARLESILLMSSQHAPQLLQMMQNLIDAAPQNIAKLEQYLASGDTENTQQLLHKIRGSYATIGADELAKQASALEQTSAGHKSISANALQGFIHIYQQSCNELQSIIQLQSVQAAAQLDTLDAAQLITLLETQNMTACNMVLQNKLSLNQLMSEPDAKLFFHQVACLDFAKAAELLHRYMPNPPKSGG